MCWEGGDGWEALCNFFGHPVPKVPLPHVRPLSDRVDPRVRAENEANIARQLAAIAAGRRQVATTPLMRDPEAGG